MAASQVGDALSGAADALAAAGVESPRLDAELLLEAVTGWDRARFASKPEAELPSSAAREFAAMVRRRLWREPVAYILGRKGFRRIELEVDPRVLIPRPETELLVEVAVERLPRRILEIGTGSGAVALALAAELPGAQVTATDDSPGALEVARGNAERLDLADRVRFEQGTWPAEKGGGPFDLLLANLPYVSEDEWARLPPEIREFEPREALVAGPTGLEVIEAVLDSLGSDPIAARAVALEVGAGQAEAAAELVRGAGFIATELRRDLAGIDRVVVGAGEDR